MSPERPPLPAWPPCALPDEPAHGWFRRLAQHNGQISARTLAESMGLNGRDPVPLDLLEFCLKFPIANPQDLIDATPVSEGRLVTLRGQTFRAGLDFSTNRPRVCPACIAESRHHRSWFDIQVLNFCPDHGVRLEHGDDQSRLAWWCPEIGVLPNGHDLADSSVPAAAALHPFESYVLGRLGVRPAQPNAWLDPTPIHEIIQIAVILGRAADTSSGYLPGRSYAAWSRFAPIGFELMQQGGDGVRAAFASLLREASQSQWGARGSLTRASNELGALPSSTLACLCLEALPLAVQDSGMYLRRPKNSLFRLPAGRLTLANAAKKLELGPRRVREIAIRLGLTPRLTSRAHCYALSNADVDRIRVALDCSISQADAAARAGLSASEFGALVVAGVIRPLIRMGGAQAQFDRFIPSEVEALVPAPCGDVAENQVPLISFDRFCKLTNKSPSEIALQLIRGDRRYIRRTPNRPGFAGCELVADEAGEAFHLLNLRRRAWSGVSSAHAAGELGVSPSHVSRLATLGHLKRLPRREGRRSGICPESLTRFSRKYASACLYADLLAIPIREVHARLRAAGIEAIEGSGPSKVYFFPRECVTRALGKAWDLEAEEASPPARVWQEVKASLSALGSANRLVGGVGLTAKLRSGDASVCAEMVMSATCDRIGLRISADQRTSRARYARLVEQQATLKWAWPGASCHHKPSLGVITLEEQFALGSEPSAKWIRLIVRQIDERVTLVRHLLSGRLTGLGDGGTTTVPT
jgi:TniQ